MHEKKHWRTIIIGGGQAGLATGYHLKRLGEDFIILDEGSQVGDVWRKRWDSLRLFTPAQYNSLPGLPFPQKRGSFPTKDEAADYFENYAKQFDLPIQFETRVTRLTKAEGIFNLTTSKGNLTSETVVICTGSNQVPYVPDFAGELNENIYQIHSSQYRNPDFLPLSDTLVVGVGTSGVEIAIELAKNRHILIAGNPVPELPYNIFKHAGRLHWLFAHYISTTNAPNFLQAKRFFRGGTPLIRVSVADLDTAGVGRLQKIVGVRNRFPLTADGREISIPTIIWATGYKPDFSWFDFTVTDETSWPATERGISKFAKGIYFVGMWFQFALTSGLIGGVGRDAEFVANHIKSGI